MTNYSSDQELDAALKHLLDIGAISMGWCDEKEEMVFFMTDEQKAMHDFDHHDDYDGWSSYENWLKSLE